MGAVETLSIILSSVALVITTVGFFASLKFYRDGVELQNQASEALAQIVARTDTIHSQVGGMFDKTLDAALGRRLEIDEHFSDLRKQLISSMQEVERSALVTIGGAGEAERERLESIVDQQVEEVLLRIGQTRGAIHQLTDDVEPPPTLDELVMFHLRQRGATGASFVELARLLGVSRQRLRRRLGRLVADGEVEHFRDAQDGPLLRAVTAKARDSDP